MSNIAVAGSAGRMGRQLLSAIFEREDVTLCGATEHPSSDAIGTDAGLLVGANNVGISLVDNVTGITGAFDTIVDFTSPVNTCDLLRLSLIHI